ncbi:MAG: hypothetical protein Q9196_001018 [Gyalolechia fulgens]
MVELRKRREAPSDIPEPPLKKTMSATKAKSEPEPNAKAGSSANGASKTKAIKVGDIIELEGFGGEVETQDGEKTNLKKLVDESRTGVVLFTYPKASTPGSTGYSIFGLSTDSPKSNTTFKTKQNLPYTLLCDPKATLISAIGLKKPPKGTTRGVFVVSKTGKIEAAEPGGPAATLEVVGKSIQNAGVSSSENVEKASGGVERYPQHVEANDTERRGEATPSKGDTDGVRAEVAAEVADTAQKLDEGAED